MVIVDASAAVAMASGNAEGRAMVQLLSDGELTKSLNFMRVEAANAVWKNVQFGNWNIEQGKMVYRAVLGSVTAFEDEAPYLMEAITEGARLNHPVYDMLYFVLARRMGATLFTLDRKLQKICAENGVNCIEIAPF